MAIIEQIPVNPNAVRVRYPVNRFSAPFLAGQYDFAQAGNTLQTVMKLASNSVYCLERVSFFANVAESDWLNSMDTVANFPRFRFKYQNSSGQSIFPEPVRCINYVDNAEQLVFFWTTRESDVLQITFEGKVNQVPGMVGVDPLLCEVNFTIYQIVDRDWITGFIQKQMPKMQPRDV